MRAAKADYCGFGAVPAAAGAFGTAAVGTFGAAGAAPAAGAAAAAFLATGAVGFFLQCAAWTLPVVLLAVFGSTNVHSALASQVALSSLAQADGAFFSVLAAAGLAAVAAPGTAGAAAGAFGTAGAAGTAGGFGAGASCAFAVATKRPSDAVAANSPSPQRFIMLFTAIISNGLCQACV